MERGDHVRFTLASLKHRSPQKELDAVLYVARITIVAAVEPASVLPGRAVSGNGVTPVMPRCGSHVDRCPWEPHGGPTAGSPETRPLRPLEG